MTPLTQCYAQGRMPLLLRPFTLVRVIVMLAVAVALSMSVTYLRFVTHDMEIESSKLQKTRLQLISQKNVLVSEVEKLKRFDNLRKDESVELGFCKCPPDRSSSVVIADSSIKKWNDLAGRMYQEDEGTYEQPAEHLLAVVGERVISWSSVSEAHEPLDSDNK